MAKTNVEIASHLHDTPKEKKITTSKKKPVIPKMKAVKKPSKSK